MKASIPRLLVITLMMVSVSFTPPKKKKIIFFGDSITQAGVEPHGYITELDSLLKARQFNNYELIGAGISGNKVYDLYLRLEKDVLDKKPDAVIIWIGVNDVWHKKLAHTGTDADKFADFYTAIIDKLQAKKIKVYLCTPAVIGEKNDMSNEMDKDLNQYAGIVRFLAQKKNCELIDLRTMFLDYLSDHNPENTDKGLLTLDGVHLNDTGNLMVATAIGDSLSTFLQAKRR